MPLRLSLSSFPAALRLAVIGALLVGSFSNSRRILQSPSTLQRNENSAPKDEEVRFSTSAQEQEPVCAPWETDMDPWWQRHPDWESHGDNATHTCFRPVPNGNASGFLRHLFETQYFAKPCGQVFTRHLLQNVGYAAGINYVSNGFWSAHRLGFPFQITRPSAFGRWMYAPKANNNKNNKNHNSSSTSWVVPPCPAMDQSCYFLPVSNCHAETGRKEDTVMRRFEKQELQKEPHRREQYAWLQHYLTRPKQFLRRELQRLEAPPLPQPQQDCTWIHVRRTDAATEAGKHPRDFHALAEYLEQGNVSKASTVLLLTDDATALEEARLLHPGYAWVSWNRTRHRGVQKKNSHTPSGDPARELLVLLAETEWAATACRKGVHGISNLVEHLKSAMIRQHGLGNFELVQIQDKAKKGVWGGGERFMQDLEQRLAQASARGGEYNNTNNSSNNTTAKDG